MAILKKVATKGRAVQTKEKTERMTAIWYSKENNSNTWDRFAPDDNKILEGTFASKTKNTAQLDFGGVKFTVDIRKNIMYKTGNAGNNKSVKREIGRPRNDAGATKFLNEILALKCNNDPANGSGELSLLTFSGIDVTEEIEGYVLLDALGSKYNTIRAHEFHEFCKTYSITSKEGVRSFLKERCDIICAKSSASAPSEYKDFRKLVASAFYFSLPKEGLRNISDQELLNDMMSKLAPLLLTLAPKDSRMSPSARARFCLFCERNVKELTADCWGQMFNFMVEIGDQMDNYDYNDGWHSLVEKYVDSIEDAEDQEAVN